MNNKQMSIIKSNIGGIKTVMDHSVDGMTGVGLYANANQSVVELTLPLGGMAK